MIQTDQNRRPASAGIVAFADQIRFLCSAITKVARADLQGRLESHDFGIGAIEHGVLRHLSHGVISMAEISRLMGVAPSTLVYVVDGLEKKSLVKRSKDPKDRRREPLLLTKNGTELFVRIPVMEGSSVLVKSLERMKEPQRRELLKLLRAFVEGLPESEVLPVRSESRQRDERSVRSPTKPARPEAKARRQSHE